ncbi:MAG: aminotransferase class V-fold PLP-dependent enzyme [Phycisphaerae bacterium]|nr:aminotransferase class V-fold PLP-dependent enzyme [Phycisphaerae bacterium]
MGNTAHFPVLGRWVFLNHAGVSPLPRCAADAIRRYAGAFEAEAYLGGWVMTEYASCRQTLARLINADVSEIALLKNTAEAISTVAFGLEWRAGDRIVTAAVEYPANIYPWLEVARRHGVEVVMIPERDRADGSRAVDPDELLAAAEHPACRLIALSHVQFASGQRMPVAEIGAWCRQRGKLLCVDAIQSLGAIPVDVRAMNIDFLAAGSQKWTLGPMGAGVVYIRRELCDLIRPLAVGAYSVIDPENYGKIDYTLQPDCRRHESGTPGLPSLLGWKASIQMLLSAGIARVEARIGQLTSHLVDGLRARGYRICSPREGLMWSGIVSFLPPGEVDPAATARRLREQHRIELVVREGRLRASPHFYNTIDEMDQLIEALP